MYKYVERDTDDVWYVGLVNPGKSLKARINQHVRDEWYTDNKFDIFYIQLASKTDCEFIESLCIDYYKSYKYGNKAKANWGESEFVSNPDEFSWELYIPDKDSLISKNELILNNLRDLRKRNEFLQHKVNEEVSKNAYLKERIVSEKHKRVFNEIEYEFNSSECKLSSTVFDNFNGIYCSEALTVLRVLKNPDITFKSALHDMTGKCIYTSELRYAPNGDILLSYKENGGKHDAVLSNIDGKCDPYVMPHAAMGMVYYPIGCKLEYIHKGLSAHNLVFGDDSISVGLIDKFQSCADIASAV